jgi:ParB family chromosome partitioning protein
MAKKALGRGLDALLSTTKPEDSLTSGLLESTEDKSLSLVEQIEIHKIQSGKHQPREIFNEEDLKSLANSVANHGVIQPILLKKISKDRYEIIAGERRWRAAKMANLQKIPAIFANFPDKETLEVAIVENLQRADLNAIEESKAYENLMTKYNLTQEEVAARVGKDRSTIANYIRLLNLPESVQERVANSEHTMGHARALLSLNTAEQILKFSEKAIHEKLSVRKLESKIKKYLSTNIRDKATSNPNDNLSNSKNKVFIDDIVEKIRSSLGTKVVVKGNDHRGSLVIEYYSKETLEGIIKKILN